MLFITENIISGWVMYLEVAGIAFPNTKLSEVHPEIWHWYYLFFSESFVSKRVKNNSNRDVDG